MKIYLRQPSNTHKNTRLNTLKGAIPPTISAGQDILALRFSGTRNNSTQPETPWYQKPGTKFGAGALLIAGSIGIKVLGLASLIAAPLLIPIALVGLGAGLSLILWGTIQACSSQKQQSNTNNTDHTPTPPYSSIKTDTTPDPVFDPMNQALTNLEKAVAENNPHQVLEAQKDIMKASKGWVKQFGTTEDKQKAEKAELAYHHYEQYIDGLDLTAPKLTFADLSPETQQNLHCALYHALTSKAPDLVNWAANYSREIGIDESFIQALIKDGGDSLLQQSLTRGKLIEQNQGNRNKRLNRNGNGN